MERLERAAVVLELLDGLLRKRTPRLETHLQKNFFVLQEVLGIPTEYHFILYKHAPFSFELRDEITAMRGDFLIELDFSSPRGIGFRITENGNRVRKRFCTVIDAHRKAIDFVVEKLGLMFGRRLERFTMALFLYLKGDGGSAEVLAERMVALKPHVSMEEALPSSREAMAFLGEVERELGIKTSVV